MGKDDVAAAIEKMVDDEDAAGRMASGDFTDLGDGELTEAEKALVQAAAGDVPEVEGFFAINFTKFTYQYDDYSGDKKTTGTPFDQALQYSGYKVGR